MAVSRFLALLLTAGVLAFPATAGAESPAGRTIVGYVETVRLLPWQLLVKAKLDTGAKTTSIDVADLRRFERDGAPWVRFTVQNNDGTEVELERPVVRTATIRRAGVGVEERPVVMLSICLGRVLKEAEVNLSFRPHMNYRMLLGRTYLRDDFLIDPGKAFRAKPRCRMPARE